MRKILVLVAALAVAGCSAWNFVSGPPSVFVVFFPDRSTDLTPAGQQIARSVAAAAHLSPEKTVQITGPSTVIVPGYDPGLAEPRMHAVEQVLQMDGVSPDRIVRASETTDGAKMKTDPSGAQRVEIRLVDAPKH
ncbi:MAG: OmpA family protein [Rhizomicrobium sp.]|jgi:outer membrane protein OmpA-like peptidoglycan-associated protein